VARSDPKGQEWTESYNDQCHKNQAHVDAKKDHLSPGHEPAMSVDIQPEHPWQTNGEPTSKQGAL
jgi:hypothetical protein